jgi:CheY-like chemotaxis protein
MTKILLVEDDKSLREIYGVRLLAEGYDIVSAGDGEQALAMAIKERPQLIVSDVMMPKISGFDMLDILRSTTETKDIKVIMMTALSSEDQRARGEALGADRYLVKSQVGIEDVVRTVHEVLADAPVAGGPAGQAFGSSAPSAAPRPAPNLPPRPAAAPTAQPQPVPHAPEPPVAPSAPPVAAPPRAAAGGQQFSSPSRPTPPPSNSSMPQPTAPFSTNRPTGLGERIIHPISQPASEPSDLSSLMDQELQGAVPAQPQASPPASSAPPPIAPPPAPTSPIAPPTPPVSQPVAFQPPAASSTPTTQTTRDPDINFEETPRSSNPFTPGAQPPSAS